MAVNVFIKDLPIKTTSLIDTDKFLVQGGNTEIVNLSSVKVYARDGYQGSTLSTTVTAVSSVSPLTLYSMTFTNGLLTSVDIL